MKTKSKKNLHSCQLVVQVVKEQEKKVKTKFTQEEDNKNIERCYIVDMTKSKMIYICKKLHLYPVCGSSIR